MIQQLECWMKQLKGKISPAAFQIRQVRRLETSSHVVLVWGLDSEQVKLWEV